MSERSHVLVRRGLNLMTVGTPETADRALALFDQAIAMRSARAGDAATAIGLDDAFDLAGAWMNRAEALLARNRPGDAAAAVDALNQAVALLDRLMPGSTLARRRLAIASHNRAVAWRRCGGRESWQAVPDLLRAIDLLEDCVAEAITDRAILLAAAWASLAEAQLAEPTEDAWERAVESAGQAVDLLAPRQPTGATAAAAPPSRQPAINGRLVPAIYQQARDALRRAVDRQRAFGLTRSSASRVRSRSSR